MLNVITKLMTETIRDHTSIIILISGYVFIELIRIISNKKNINIGKEVKIISQKLFNLDKKVDSIMYTPDLKSYINQATTDAMCYINSSNIKEFLSIKSKSILGFIEDLISQNMDQMKTDDVDNLLTIYIKKFNCDICSIVSKEFKDEFWNIHEPYTQEWINNLKDIISDSLMNSKKRRITTVTKKYYEDSIKYIVRLYYQFLEERKCLTKKQ